MPYVTVKQSQSYHQMSLDELLFSDHSFYDPLPKPKFKNVATCTRTYYVERVNDKLSDPQKIMELILTLEKFNSDAAPLFEVSRQSLYHSFDIPKKNGKKRHIDAPLPELMTALRVLKTIFEQKFHALYHTSAFAYIPGRCTVDAVKRHQENDSRWFLKTDFSNFFGSTTLEFVMEMFSRVHPFSEVVRYPRGRAALEQALSLCFLNGGLPQGTPISPLITNVMMIPVDHALYNSLRDFDKKNFVYTRYADDIHISCRYDFSFRKVERHINETLAKFNAPFKINPEKTHYGSRSGRNWILGVMLNKDNVITLGHQKKKELRAHIYNYLVDRANGIPTSVQELMELQGMISYFDMVEHPWIDAVIKHYNKALNTDLMVCLKSDIAA